MNPFELNGTAYSTLRIPEGGISRSAAVMDGEAAGRAKALNMIRDIKGTFYNYKIQIDTSHASAEEYDTLYSQLSNPNVDSHLLTVPFGQGTITFDAYISNLDDILQSMAGGVNLWTGLTLSFIAISPQRVPN